MESLKRLYHSSKFVPILVIAVLVLVLGSTVAYAAGFVLNQAADITVTVNSVSEPPTSAYIYTDEACTNKLTSMDISYDRNDFNVLVCYVKASEITNIAEYPVITGSMSDIVIAVSLGDIIGSAREVFITTSGGSAGSYNGTVTFTGS